MLLARVDQAVPPVINSRSEAGHSSRSSHRLYGEESCGPQYVSGMSDEPRRP